MRCTSTIQRGKMFKGKTVVTAEGRGVGAPRRGHGDWGPRQGLLLHMGGGCKETSIMWSHTPLTWRCGHFSTVLQLEVSALNVAEPCSIKLCPAESIFLYPTSTM